MPFLGHNQYDGLDVSPNSTPSAVNPAGPTDVRARHVVSRFARDSDDELMLLELLGLHTEPSM